MPDSAGQTKAFFYLSEIGCSLEQQGSIVH